MERFDLIAGSEGRLLAFCEAGVLFELPWAKAKLGAATANAPITTKGLNIIPAAPVVAQY